MHCSTCMRNILILLFIVSAQIAYSQDTCTTNVKNWYSELTPPVTEYFHENGQISHRYITKNEKTTKVHEWDSCGNCIRKTKSRVTNSKKGPCSRRRQITYYAHGQIETKSSSKMCDCLHLKRSRRKMYSEDGKRTK